MFDVLRPALVEIVRDAGEPPDDSFLEGDFPIATPAGVRSTGSCATSASRTAPGGSTRPRIRSAPRSRTGRPADDALPARQPRVALVDACTRRVTASRYKGVDPALGRSPLDGTPSLGLNESQSRTWENLVGRSLPFWRGRYRAAAALPAARRGRARRLLRAINRAEPGLIRVEADETTYWLHIILRFELEQELIAGTLAPDDLPEAWNARMADFLGVEVPDDCEASSRTSTGRGGSFGYFPTYALGNVISLQIWRAVEEELPDLDAQLEAGEFGPLSEWLRDTSTRTGASSRRRRRSSG